MQKMQEAEEEEEETDLEDKLPVVVVPDSLSDGLGRVDRQSASSDDTGILLYVQGRLIASGDIRNVQNESDMG